MNPPEYLHLCLLFVLNGHLFFYSFFDLPFLCFYLITLLVTKEVEAEKVIHIHMYLEQPGLKMQPCF